MAHLIELKDLIEAGLHFGHQTKRWNPKMKSYIFDKRNGIHIIDLTQTVELIDEAAEFLRGVVAKGQKILFVATKKQAQEVVKEAALTCNQFYMTERWLGGTLTNNQTIRRSVKRMQQIQNIARQNNGVLSEHKQEASAARPTPSRRPSAWASPWWPSWTPTPTLTQSTTSSPATTTPCAASS